MPSCLGLYIEDNLIKYAKVSKEKENIKVESFGVKFYSAFETAIKQIVDETYSSKLPISINTNDEWYNEMRIFNGLQQKDIKNAIKTSFEDICYDKELNKNIYEERYFYSNSDAADNKIKVIHMAVPKTTLEHRKNQLANYRINNISPLSIAISNLARKEKKGTVMVVNIESKTTITKITNGVVSNVQVLNQGAKEILDKINEKENSYSKSYEICKGATIYIENDKETQYEENEYLEDIMPVLFDIVSNVRKSIDESIENIEKLYITGTGAIINNVEIYFQEYLRDVKCEILKPSFISNNSKINMKDYIEVNSAIALALQGLEKNNKDINFNVESAKSLVLSFVKGAGVDFKNSKASKAVDGIFEKFNGQFNMLSITFLLITIFYISGVIILNEQLEKKISETETSKSNMNATIEKIQEYDRKFNSQISEYSEIIANIQNINAKNSENKRYRNTIPNLLNNIMAVIPVGVQLTSINNTTDTHVIIKAQSKSYEEIAYFKAKLKAENILKNVVSDTGTLSEPFFNVTIEGELP